MAACILLRIIRARKKGLAAGRQKQMQGPAAVPGHGAAYVHVYGVHIRPFLPVYFYGNKMPVYQLCGFRVGKAFLGHGVAPVTGTVADGKQDRLVLRLRFFKGFRAPRIPIYRVFCMLQKIRAFTF